MTIRRRKSAEDRKADILEAALTLAYEVGPDLVTTGMIADKLKLSQPAIYKHYSSKNDVWDAVADLMTARISDNIAAVDDTGPDPLIRLRQLVIGHLKLVQEYPSLPDIMVARDSQNNLHEGRKRLQNAMAGFRRALTENIGEAVKLGLFRTGLSEKDAASLIFGVIQSLVLQMLINRTPANLLTDGDRLLSLLLAGFTDTGTIK